MYFVSIPASPDLEMADESDPSGCFYLWFKKKKEMECCILLFLILFYFFPQDLLSFFLMLGTDLLKQLSL